MIRVKDYVIDADNCQYIVGKQKVRVKKDGETEQYIANPKYCMSLHRAFECILEAERRDIVSDGDMSVMDAMVRLNDMHEEFTALFRIAAGLEV